MLRNKRPQLIENEGRQRQKSISSCSTFRAKIGMGLGAQILYFSETILESTNIDLGSQNGVPRPFSRACFSGFQLRDTIIEKNAPLPGENHIFACWRGLKTCRFGIPKSIKNLYFFDIHLGSVFCWFFQRKWRFWESKTEAKFQQKSIPRWFAWSVEKSYAQAVLRQNQPVGPEASPGGLGGLLSTTY